MNSLSLPTKRFTATTLLCMAAMFASLAPAVASQEVGMFKGRCTFSDGSPASDALVQVFTGDSGDSRNSALGRLPGIDLRPTDWYSPAPRIGSALPIASVVTDKNGIWQIAGIRLRQSFVVTAQSIDKSGLSLGAARTDVPLGWKSGQDVPLILDVINLTIFASPPPFSANNTTVFFATDRAIGPVAAIPRDYLDEPGDGTVRFGSCDVETDALHRVRCHEVSESAMLAAMRTAALSTPNKQLLLFVHGFNCSFVDAARSSAMLSLGTGRTAFFYDWTSRDSVVDYTQDEDSIDGSLFPNGLKLISQLIDSYGRDRLVIVAHSMGSRLIYEAMHIFAFANSSGAHHAGFKAVAIAAGDVFVRKFRQGFSAIQPLTDDFDNYASSHDQALLLSEHFHVQDPRLGQTTPEMTVAEGLTSIDASAAKTDWLGHGYFLDPDLVADLKDLFDGKDVKDRRHLAVHGSSGYFDFIP